jgi:hypothetical protein
LNTLLQLTALQLPVLTLLATNGSASSAALRAFQAGRRLNPSMKPEDQTTGEVARQQGAVVLVVGDEWIVRKAVADYLRGCSYCVQEAVNADEAIASGVGHRRERSRSPSRTIPELRLPKGLSVGRLGEARAGRGARISVGGS